MNDASRPGAVVLVHGGAHGSWCWDRLRAVLDHPTVAVDLPGRPSSTEPAPRTMADYTRSVVKQIEAAEVGDVVLVGHSLAGLVLPIVAEELGERVRHLVFLSAVAAATDTTAVGNLPTPLRQVVNRGLTRAAGTASGAVELPRWVVRAGFCTGLDAQDRRTVLERTHAEPAAPLTDTVPRARLRPDLPRTYVGFRSDRAIPPAVQRRLARALDAPLVTLEGGHDGMIGNPAGLARVLGWIANDSLGAAR